MRALVHRYTLTDPGDVGVVQAAMERGELDPARIVAVIGKTPGNGLVNDYTRGYLTQSLALLIADRTGAPSQAVMERVPFIFSGGTEGVLTPHVTVFSVDPAAEAGADAQPSLAVATAFTRPLTAEDIGLDGQVEATREAVRRAMAEAAIERPEDLHFVQVKGPCLTAAALNAALSEGLMTAGDTPDKSMAWSRVASAFGVALALGEIAEETFDPTAMLRDFGQYSSVASCSSGVEVRVNEIVVLGNSRRWAGPLHIAHQPMVDALDIGAVHRVLEDLGLPAQPQLSADQRARLAAVFVKCEPDRSGKVRGEPHTMLNDGDMHAQRHIRGAVGALVAGVTGDTRLFVSGGAEHQGPDGGGLIAAIARRGEC
ncbi:MAG: ring-opening amidohydrolase [Ectothiorhodospiraceae bacterium]|nr:ring-opening amidohydrolase [Ectothiorhodospiraceae bacterium]MCH8504648.1 ring-opening amidohydrolase [Ectothiorhodospiraceae bacterium]